MFRLAIISDVHADVHALTDALATIDRMACDAVVCAGDVVDFGLFPDETIAMLAARRIPTVRGNHDRWAVAGEHRSGWSSDLSRESKRWLAGLPTSLRLEHEGGAPLGANARDRSRKCTNHEDAAATIAARNAALARR